ncbi:MAG: hypothetical protein COB84_05060 [Rhodobacteraceae bacterium]|nr:MAG: hypothetical protein COB84_05060 [Paracoccaceae bacterium]
MSSWVTPLLTAIVAGFIGAWLTYAFALRKDREERRRERIVSHLIEAYRNIEFASSRKPLTEDEKTRVETSVAAIFLFGSKKAVNDAEDFVHSMDAENLLRTLRNELRNELDLEPHDVKLLHLRFNRLTEDVK